MFFGHHPLTVLKNVLDPKKSTRSRPTCPNAYSSSRAWSDPGDESCISRTDVMRRTASEEQLAGRSAEKQMTLGRRIGGVACIVSVVLLWVGSSELIQFIFDSNKFKFESPLFLTFYSTSLFAVYLSGFLLSSRWRRSLSGVCVCVAVRGAW